MFHLSQISIATNQFQWNIINCIYSNWHYINSIALLTYFFLLIESFFSLFTSQIQGMMICSVSDFVFRRLVEITFACQISWLILYLPATTIMSLNDMFELYPCVTAQEGAMILRMNIRIKIRKVWKESCYGKAETLEDAEEAARWW